MRGHLRGVDPPGPHDRWPHQDRGLRIGIASGVGLSERLTGLRTPDGGIRAAHGRALDEPRLFLIGYGPSQSTVGANRAGRDAVRAILADLRAAGAA